MLELTELNDGFAVGIVSAAGLNELDRLTKICLEERRTDGFYCCGVLSQQPRFTGDNWHHVIVATRVAPIAPDWQVAADEVGSWDQVEVSDSLDERRQKCQ